jgi:hypothetical protein
VKQANGIIKKQKKNFFEKMAKGAQFAYSAKSYSLLTSRDYRGLLCISAIFFDVKLFK